MESGTDPGTVRVMPHLIWLAEPTATGRPVMLAAFGGWNDAGDAATRATSHLVDHFDASLLAEIDPEEFYDFTVTRPHVVIGEDDERSVEWPRNTFSWAVPEGTDGVVLLNGVEPQLRWRTFCEQVIEVVERLDVSMVVTLGALLAEVPHTRPTPVFGTTDDEALIEALGLEPSQYEGPTGIVGVLHAQCAAAGVDSASLWAAVPSYVPAVPSPRATLALVERTAEILSITPPTMALQLEAAAYEHEITEVVEDDDTTADYVRSLEEQYDQNAMAVQSADDMVEEVERFLRDQRDQ